MTQKEITNEVRKVIVLISGCNSKDVMSNTSIRKDLGLDSLDEVAIIVELEAVFGIEIPDEDLMDRDCNVQDIVDYIAKRITAIHTCAEGT